MNVDLRNKKVTIIGAKRSGVAAAKLLQTLGAIPFVSDVESKHDLENYLLQLQEMNIEYEIGGHTNRVYDADLFVISPGVPSNAEIILEAKRQGKKIVSEVELASWFCISPIIAITGTNGKTTTTALIGKIFSDFGKETFVCGNIGTPFSSCTLQTNTNSIVVLEVSSYQLDFCETFHPNVSIITNITPDHLDRYENKMENYVASKARISMNQTSSDIFLFNANDAWTSSLSKKTNAQTFGFSSSAKLNDGAFLENDVITTNINGKQNSFINRKEMFIPGMHNAENAMAATLAAQLFDVSVDSIRDTLRTFKGVEHRIEFVRELDGVKYYNDSKATNVDAVIPALKAFDLEGEQKIFLLLGGRETRLHGQEGNDYSAIRELVKNNVRSIIAIGESAEKVFNFFSSIVNVEIAPSMKEAVIKAKAKSFRNDIILLSPACKSFDWYLNFEERGNDYKQIVRSL
ncbi:MAG: UDP-N-acetylmuramoyl-L-alanine--D-glutamate ligase [Ignavibacteriales bacterium]|nr:UDP-N-acetylmuramoyl-L-alanine--D-glutamate ligase [Ignavibacteriales bacterium]